MAFIVGLNSCAEVLRLMFPGLLKKSELEMVDFGLGQTRKILWKYLQIRKGCFHSFRTNVAYLRYLHFRGLFLCGGEFLIILTEGQEFFCV